MHGKEREETRKFSFPILSLPHGRVNDFANFYFRTNESQNILHSIGEPMALLKSAQVLSGFHSRRTSFRKIKESPAGSFVRDHNLRHVGSGERAGSQKTKFHNKKEEDK